MIFDLLRGGDLKEILLGFLLSLPGIVIALSIHEYAHGLVSNHLGDPTAKSMGRLSLNPLRHIDPFGFFSMLLFGFGWARPVLIDHRYLKKPRRDMALISLAGPLSNWLTALILSFALVAFVFFYPAVYVSSWAYTVYQILLYAIILNVNFGLFNLIPCPPLDGSKVLFSFLPHRVVWKITQYERYFPLALILLLYSNVLDTPLSFLSQSVFSFFITLAENTIGLFV